MSIQPNLPRSFHMADDKPSFTFREKMAGGFALGETDPETGEKAGQSAGNVFTMHGTILIDDLERFMSDPNHPGSITGSIDFDPVGRNLPSTAGVFNLF